MVKATNCEFLTVGLICFSLFILSISLNSHFPLQPGSFLSSTDCFQTVIYYKIASKIKRHLRFDVVQVCQGLGKFLWISFSAPGSLSPQPVEQRLLFLFCCWREERGDNKHENTRHASYFTPLIPWHHSCPRSPANCQRGWETGGLGAPGFLPMCFSSSFRPFGIQHVPYSNYITASRIFRPLKTMPFGGL